MGWLSRVITQGGQGRGAQRKPRLHRHELPVRGRAVGSKAALPHADVPRGERTTNKVEKCSEGFCGGVYI